MDVDPSVPLGDTVSGDLGGQRDARAVFPKDSVPAHGPTGFVVN